MIAVDIWLYKDGTGLLYSDLILRRTLVPIMLQYSFLFPCNISFVLIEDRLLGHRRETPGLYYKRDVYFRGKDRSGFREVSIIHRDCPGLARETECLRHLYIVLTITSELK